jgi:hypothetical protein
MEELTKLAIGLGMTEVEADWDWALNLVRGLKDAADFPASTAVRVLAEYGAIVHRESLPGGEVKINLAVVIAPPEVFICAGGPMDGVFIQPYSEEKFGGFHLKHDRPQFLSYTNIQARMDGWEFFNFALQCSHEAKGRGPI